MKPIFSRQFVQLLLAASMALALVLPASGQDFTLQRAIQLALTHSTATGASAADQMHAYESYVEARSSFIPQVTVGSDVGYAYGFPLSLEGSAPTIFNVTSQSYVLNLAQKEFVRAAKAEWQASSAQDRDQRAQVMLDTALSYAELNKWERELQVLQDQSNVTHNIEFAVLQRVKEGLDSQVDETKARLTSAQVRLKIAQAEGSADLLRTHLSQLTGVPAASITTLNDSIPALPTPDPPAGGAAAQTAVQNSDVVEASELRARAQLLKAKGEHRALLPSIDFAAQYGLISSALTNFEQFFRVNTFQNQNVTFGLVIRLPFLNYSQKAAARAADAEAIRAQKDAQAAKDQVSMETMRLQRGVEQAAAARDVADLQNQLAQSGVTSAQARMQAATATLGEMQTAQFQADLRSTELMDADFELEKAQLQLLRATGELEKWAFRHP
ncbi:MAG TPA: TolC family protein [Terriglobales bacterium]|nr:TolC family protein [Terriglobales bacterium]